MMDDDAATAVDEKYNDNEDNDGDGDDILLVSWST